MGLGLFMQKDWAEALREEFQKPYIKKLQNFLMEENKKYQIFPPENLIFNAFCQTALKDVKVVIIGQDPYHGEGQAHGLSFSVPKNINPPPSLKNIFKEIKEDVGMNIPNSGDLTNWAKQGVLLLNATLTVRKSCPKSHYGMGWEIFTDKVVEILISQKDQKIVFMLWGASAKEKIEKVFKDQNHPHLILKAAHPSFYSAANFFGCRHFSKANEFLRKNGKKEINWQI
ncbi:MAG: uracil-DNA glycosylase [Parachlamydiales bacterium]|nr:uracil-DNA glycosylase [Parachlamydiales bacterium]